MKTVVNRLIILRSHIRRSHHLIYSAEELMSQKQLQRSRTSVESYADPKEEKRQKPTWRHSEEAATLEDGESDAKLTGF